MCLLTGLQKFNCKAGPLAINQYLTILDCFTNGKGDTAQVFNQFYEMEMPRYFASRFSKTKKKAVVLLG